MSETISFKTGWLKDPADNQKFAPKTTTNQVLTGDGKRLTTELENIHNEIIDANSYTDTEVAKKALLSTEGFFTSDRDFENGTLITTDIDYSQPDGCAWLFELKGNSYGEKFPFDLTLQGYICDNTITQKGGVSNSLETAFSDICAFCYNDKLCFWFGRMSYWQGFSVRVTDVSTDLSEGAKERQNCVIAITDEVKPTDIIKEVTFNDVISHSITDKNILKYKAGSAVTADTANKATFDSKGNGIFDTYELKADATQKLADAKSFATSEADRVKNDLLNGAGEAYDTLKELGDLIDENVGAIKALETVASRKESKVDAAAKLAEAKSYTDTLETRLTDSSQENSLTVAESDYAVYADTAYFDVDGNAITETYETKSDATSKHTDLKTKVEKAMPFIATYNQTSFNDIKAAYDLGRSIQVYREFELPAAGAYDADGNMIYSWQELLDMDVEYQEFDGYDETGANIWATKVGKCLTVEDGVLKSIVTYSPSTNRYTNHSANALSGASKLIISNDVTSIGSEGLAAFNIKEIILPSTVTTIEEYAFAYIYEYYDDYYSTIYIPYSVNSISFNAFYHSYVSLKYEGTETEFSSIASIRDFNTNTYSFSYTCGVSLLNNPILGQLISVLDNKFIFTAHEASGEVEYECSKNYGWLTRNIQAFKLGDAIFKYDYDNARIVISFPDVGAVG